MTHWRNYSSWLAWMSWRRRQERGRSGPFCLDWGPDWLQKMVGWRDLFLILIFHLVVQLPQLWQKNFSLRIIKVILILIHTWAAIRMQQWGLKKLRVGHSYGFGLFMGFIKKKWGTALDLSFKANLICLVWNSRYIAVTHQHINTCCSSTINIGLHALITGFRALTSPKWWSTSDAAFLPQ